MEHLSKIEAGRFLLLWHGLGDDRIFNKATGITDFLARVGCFQFDPIDACGKNAELLLNSRIDGFSKDDLSRLLYDERVLYDYFDKNLSIIFTDQLPYFCREKVFYSAESRSSDRVEQVGEEIIAALKAHGPLSSIQLGALIPHLAEKVSWYWGPARLSRAALETLYFRCKLSIHHKQGAIKFYDLSENCLKTNIHCASDPILCDYEHKKWRIMRRIGAVGLLWNKPSDAFLGIRELSAADRTRGFQELLEQGEIIQISVDGISQPLYCQSGAKHLISQVKQPFTGSRCEFLAPLDSLLWDRKLISSIFDFDYTWEIYTPESKRKYGYYTLPILFKDRLVGRIEPVCDRKTATLTVKNLWFQDDFEPTAQFTTALDSALNRLATLNGCLLSK